MSDKKEVVRDKQMGDLDLVFDWRDPFTAFQAQDAIDETLPPKPKSLAEVDWNSVWRSRAEWIVYGRELEAKLHELLDVKTKE